MNPSSRRQSLPGGCGCLLLIFAFGFLVAGVILRPIMPNFVHSMIDGMYDIVLCSPDERYEQDPFLRGAMRRNIVGEGDAYCINERGERRDISYSEFNLAIALFVIPAGIDAVLAAKGSAAVPRRPQRSAAEAPGSSLSAKLRELQDAYDQGLITKKEFDSTRQNLLNNIE
jgi:hypothetical protein